MIQLTVVTPERALLNEQVDELQIPGAEGYLGVLPGHAPLFTELKVGELSYRKGSTWTSLVVAWGFAEVLQDQVRVLAQTAERLHVGALTEQVDGDDGPRAWGDRRLDLLGVDVPGVRVDVHEDGPGPGAADGPGGGEEREGRRDDLVPRADLEGGQGQEQGVGAG